MNEPDSLHNIYQNLLKARLSSRNLRWEVIIHLYKNHESGLTQSELKSYMDISFPSLRYHIKQLLDFGLIMQTVKVNGRGSVKVYHLTPSSLDALRKALE